MGDIGNGLLQGANDGLADYQRALGGGLGGLAQTNRPAPAEDLVQALSKLNAAIKAARSAGWTVEVEAADGEVKAQVSRSI